MTQYLGKTVMRQFSNSATLLQLLADFDQWCDLTQFSAAFLANVWDISQAQGFGLDIWGRILGVTRYLYVTPLPLPGQEFGFSNTNAAPTPSAGQDWLPWSQGPFFGGSAPSNRVIYKLSDTDFRKLLLVKAAANIATCDAPSLNALARAMFGTRGKSYVLQGSQPMHMEYHFEFVPTPSELAIIQSGLFPSPAGMTVTYIHN